MGDEESASRNGFPSEIESYARRTTIFDYLFRGSLINITPDDIFTVSLQTAEGPEEWMPLTKDGARLPPAEAVLGPARQTLAVGETYDFEYQAPAARKTVWIEIRNRSGKWQAQGQVNVK